MYVSPNYPSKKALKEAVAAGKQVTVFQPNGDLFPGSGPPQEGVVTVEGPHYPKPHKWYGQVELKGGVVVKVK